MNWRRLDVIAGLAAVVSLVMLVVYVRLIQLEGDEPALWAVAILVFGTAAATYGAFTTAPGRQPVLVLAAFALGVLGVLGILTIGMPILAAAALCFISAMRPAPDGVMQTGAGSPRTPSAP